MDFFPSLLTIITSWLFRYKLKTITQKDVDLVSPRECPYMVWFVNSSGEEFHCQISSTFRVYNDNIHM